MRPFTLLILTVLFLLTTANAQVYDDFSDGDFTNNPQWHTSPGDWIINGDGQLQSNNQYANSTFYISTQNALSSSAQWEFYVRLNFNTSSANYVDVFLISSAADLTAKTTTGYFVRIGNTQDDICLYRKDAGTMVKIIDGTDGVTNTSDNTLKIKVIRTTDNTFILFRDDSGTGNHYIKEGSATDATYTSSAYFGFLIKQSTGSFFQKHYFDDIFVQSYVPDVTPPGIKTITAASAFDLDVLFNEPLDGQTAEDLNNYSVDHGYGTPLTSVLDAADNALVHLHFGTAFTTGPQYILTVRNIKDLSDNVLAESTSSFDYYLAGAFDIVIDEIMADPAPAVGLPPDEYVELKNISGKAISLKGWKFGTNTSSSSSFPDYTIPADSFLILCSASHVPDLIKYGCTLGVPNFPSVTNSGNILTLTNREGKAIHAVRYNKDWYQNTIKAQGGWSLEMIDTHNPCTGSDNWKASINPNGGTPGRINSIDGVNKDTEPPQLIRTYATDSMSVVVLFNEPLDSLSAASPSAYSLDNNMDIISAIPVAPLFDQVILKTSAPLENRKVYQLTVRSVADCKGNMIGSANQAPVGVFDELSGKDLVINEILYNPRPGAYDYIELYNKSDMIINAHNVYIANRNDNGDIANARRISDQPFAIFPGSYVVITEDAASLAREYLVRQPGAVLILSSLPSYPDDKGTVVLSDSQGTIIDEVSYTDKWQFPLISNSQGVSLERIDPDRISQDQDNWHSAASTAGYGTPTYKNSQYKADQSNTSIHIDPGIFSPGNDGYDDFTRITYQADQPGYVANISIFNANGKPVRYLVKNSLMGIKGSWTWDGLDEQAQRLPAGNYIVFIELFNLEGKTLRFKEVVVLARKSR